jgi:hypothetical protein
MLLTVVPRCVESFPLSKAKTPKPETPAMRPQPLPSFEKLYWLRVGFAAVAGLAAELLVGTDYATGISIGIAFYLVSYYLARFTWYKGLAREGQAKVYTTGIGGFIMIFLFAWMLFFTLHAAGYPL